MKKNIILSIIILLIIGCLITIFNFKKNYYVSKNQIIENNKSYAIYVKENGSSSYSMQSAIPKGKYSLNLEKTICENGGTVSNYDSTNGTVLFTTLGSDRCTLYFDYKLSLKEKILADNPTVSTRTDFSVTNIANTTGTIYSTTATEDGSTVYYYSGNTTNNWVKFGKTIESSCTYNGEEVIYYDSDRTLHFILSESDCLTTNLCELSGLGYAIGLDKSACTSVFYGTYVSGQTVWNGITTKDIYWRIIRINEDMGIRMLYSGTSPSTTEGYIGVSGVNKNNNDSLYAGYMYGTSGTLTNNRKNTNSSSVKLALDTWYQNNLLTNYDKYISKTAIYCNDRSVGSGTYSANGTAGFNFSAYIRLSSNKKPTYKCGGNTTGGLFESTQAVEDKFSASTTGGGNGQLQYPIALMTADEVAFAGGLYNNNLESPYAWYYTNSIGESITGERAWLTMTPFDLSASSSPRVELMRIIGSNLPGRIRVVTATGLNGVRPVLTLKSCVDWSSGNGTPSNPYTVSVDNACAIAEN